MIKIPEFKSIEEEAEFWDTHSIAEVEDELEVVDDVGFVVRQPKRNICIRLDQDTLEQVKKIAAFRRVGASTLLRMWTAERVRKELAAIGAQRESADV